MCNLRCKHCFVDLTDRHTLSVEQAEAIAGELDDMLWLDIGGGEPFLLDELELLIAPFRCEVLGINTNGHTPNKVVETTRRILETTAAQDVVVGVSIEGFREEHTEIRRHPQSYDRAFETLAALKDLSQENPRLRVKCNTVITNKNVARLVEFMEYVRDSELVDFHSVIMLRGLPHGPGVELPYVETLRSLRPRIFEVLESYLWGCGLIKRNFLRKYYRFLWDVSLANLERHTQVIPCVAGRAHLVIWANGDVSSCELLPPVGNVVEKPLSEVLAGAKRQDQLAHIRQKKCSCTHNCAMLDSILLNPMNYPKLLVR